MSSILFVTWDGGGNLPPALGIAAELKQCGHEVRFIGHAGQAERLQAAGFEFVAYAAAREFAGTDDSGPLDILAVFGDRGMGADVVAEFEARPPGLVVVDSMLAGPMEALARAGIPYVLLSHTFDAFYRGSWLRGPLGIGLRAKGFRPQRLAAGAQLRIIPTLRALDPAGARQPAPNVNYTSPVVTGTPAAGGRASTPTVLVSLSTGNYPGMRQVLQNALDAVGRLDVRAIVTTGPSIDPADLRVPANARAHRFIPHAELMPTASMVIGHGGHGTTMAALAHDLPVVVLPLHPMLDHKMIGAAVERAGAGRLLRKKAPPDEIAAVARDLLAEGPHRAAAAALGAAIRAGRGAAASADALQARLLTPPGRLPTTGAR
jgi:UDP:flavonoid glycosyltransferase YjiC (YdhE family)